MIEFPVGEEALDTIVENRHWAITSVLTFFTYLGEDEGYILIITFIYMFYDKRLAIRLALVVLATMAINHLLKMFIGNPRPFVKEGSYMNKWLISPEYARELATEFSTPSGHAMSSFVFYGYAYRIFRHPYFRITAILTILFIGISRPYLAVHYIEDVLLGWVLGFLIVALVINYSTKLERVWKKLQLVSKLGLIVTTSLIAWTITLYLKGWDISLQPLPFVGHFGFILGVMLGTHLEQESLNFDPRSKTAIRKVLRWLMTIVLVMVPLLLLDIIPATSSNQSTYLSHLLYYLCYTLSGFLGIYVGPFLSLKLKLVSKQS